MICVIYAPRSPVADNTSGEGKIPISADEHRVLLGVGDMLELPLRPRPRRRRRRPSLLLLLLLPSAWTAGRFELSAAAAASSRRDFLFEELLLPRPPALVLVTSVLAHFRRCRCWW